MVGSVGCYKKSKPGPEPPCFQSHRVTALPLAHAPSMMQLPTAAQDSTLDTTMSQISLFPSHITQPQESCSGHRKQMAQKAMRMVRGSKQNF